jgi:hypothetical protein
MDQVPLLLQAHYSIPLLLSQRQHCEHSRIMQSIHAARMTAAFTSSAAMDCGESSADEGVLALHVYSLQLSAQAAVHCHLFAHRAAKSVAPAAASAVKQLISAASKSC